MANGKLRLAAAAPSSAFCHLPSAIRCCAEGAGATAAGLFGLDRRVAALVAGLAEWLAPRAAAALAVLLPDAAGVRVQPEEHCAPEQPTADAPLAATAVLAVVLPLALAFAPLAPISFAAASGWAAVSATVPASAWYPGSSDTFAVRVPWAAGQAFDYRARVVSPPAAWKPQAPRSDEPRVAAVRREASPAVGWSFDREAES